MYSDIPDNTAEVWTNPHGLTQSHLTTRGSGPGFVGWSLDALLCILKKLYLSESGKLKQEAEQEQSPREDLFECFNPSCFEQCRIYNSEVCVHVCLAKIKIWLSQSVGRFKEKRRASVMVLSVLHNMLSGNDEMLDDGFGFFNDPDERSQLPSNVPEESDTNAQPMPLKYPTRNVRSNISKRYRLGLYDCISSYCGSLSGESRKLCIVEQCHRTAQIEE